MYKVGEKVVIKEDISDHWNIVGNMYKYQGAIMTVRSANLEKNSYTMEEDKHEAISGYYWSNDIIDHYETEKLHRLENALEFKDLEEGKKYKEITKHCFPDGGYSFKFTIKMGDLYYMDKQGDTEWSEETVPLLSILDYRFEEIEKSFPQVGDKYFCIDFGAEDSIAEWDYDGGDFDLKYLNANDMFKTKEEAEKKLEQIKKILNTK